MDLPTAYSSLVISCDLICFAWMKRANQPKNWWCWTHCQRSERFESASSFQPSKKSNTWKQAFLKQGTRLFDGNIKHQIFQIHTYIIHIYMDIYGSINSIISHWAPLSQRSMVKHLPTMVALCCAMLHICPRYILSRADCFWDDG